MSVVPENFSREVGGVFFGQFAELRPMQAAAIQSICAGRDVILSAGTGSGKTEAAVAPLVSRFRKEALQHDVAVLIYVCPTKALINDLARRLKPALDRLGLNLAIRHGDRNELDSGKTAHVIVTTPESLGILLLKSHPALPTVRAVVFDEVHLLYNNQRGLMAAVLLHRLKMIGENPIQTAALSATVGSLNDIRSFLLGDGTEADLLAFSGARVIDGDIRPVSSVEGACDLLERLMDAPNRKLLVFVNSRREAEELAAELKSRAGMEDLVGTHHSSLSPDGREAVESWFGSTGKAICVSTSTLEMGIDIGDIDAVVLYGPPFSVESLLQRIGRGNRRSNKTNVICLSREDGASHRETAIFSTMLGLASQGRMPGQSSFLLFGAIAQQALSIILQADGAFTKIADIREEVGCRSDLERPLTEEILDELQSHGLVQRHGFKNRFGAADGLWELRDKNLIWGNFPLAGQSIELEHNGRILGEIPRANLMRLGRGSVFLFGGSRFRVVGMIDRQLRVKSAPGKGGEVRLIYSREGPGGLDAFVANSLWEWLFSVTLETSFMTEENWIPVERFLNEIREVVGLGDLPFSDSAKGTRWFTFAGETVNRVILAWLGLNPENADDLSIVVPSSAPDWSKLPVSTIALKDAAERCFAPSERQTIFQQYLPIELQRKEWMESWLKDNDAQAVLSRLQKGEPKTVPKHLFFNLFS